jgi:hypothetical protein
MEKIGKLCKHLTIGISLILVKMMVYLLLVLHINRRSVVMRTEPAPAPKSWLTSPGWLAEAGSQGYELDFPVHADRDLPRPTNPSLAPDELDGDEVIHPSTSYPQSPHKVDPSPFPIFPNLLLL